jgi:hypothetical protein
MAGQTIYGASTMFAITPRDLRYITFMADLAYFHDRTQTCHDKIRERLTKYPQLPLPQRLALPYREAMEAYIQCQADCIALASSN